MTLHPYNPLRLIIIPSRLSTVAWCEEHVYLSPRVPTSEPGQWRATTVAALCLSGGPLEALDESEVETVVVMKGSQTALTTTAYCWLAKELDHDPSSALIVMNSAQDAKEKSDETWRPIWEDSHRLQRFLPKDRRKNWTKLFQRINGVPVYWIGANSPGRLGSKPIRRLILDEVDKYPQQTKSEAGAAALARQRTKSFRKKGLAKILQFSTPTDDGGEINREYLNGDQRKLYVKCHACKAEQIMVWQNFRIDMAQAQTDAPKAVAGAHYECPHCKTPWMDDQRWAVIDAGVWKPTTTPRDPKCRSFWLPSWCSKFVTCNYLAAQWVKAQQGQSALQDFINAECGEPYVHFDNRIKDATFAELEGDYIEGQMFADQPAYAGQYPKERERWVIGGVDVQKGYLMAVFRLFVDGGDSGLMWAGDVGNFEKLDILAEQYDAKFIIIDQRYRTREVQEWCFEHAGYIPSMGVAHRARSLFTAQTVDLDEGRVSGKGRKIASIDFDPDMLKDILAVQIQRAEGSRRWLVPKGYAMNATYVQQMTAERCVNGRWINPQNRANHVWDCESLALLGAIRFGVWGNSNPGEEKK
ncbi:MAG: phage terminase large subunit family protein [Kiritimatiellae bacterium]|nr:phage terminase large subunit family protein [Kiritimatiellia bacterium]